MASVATESCGLRCLCEGAHSRTARFCFTGFPNRHNTKHNSGPAPLALGSSSPRSATCGRSSGNARFDNEAILQGSVLAKWRSLKAVQNTSDQLLPRREPLLPAVIEVHFSRVILCRAHAMLSSRDHSDQLLDSLCKKLSVFWRHRLRIQTVSDSTSTAAFPSATRRRDQDRSTIFAQGD